MQIIKSSNSNDIEPFIKDFSLPKPDSHKGQNGKILIVGGSDLFHAASLWSAEVASHFMDMVHYCSTDENNALFASLKKIFRNGIAIPRSSLEDYVREDDVILVGPGLERKKETAFITEKVFELAKDKNLVVDAGSLQMMKPELLKDRSNPAIITPHEIEFEKLFGEKIVDLPFDAKVNLVEKKAREFSCVILFKAIDDVVTDGKTTVVVRGGNQGLTKGGTGDILAGLIASLSYRTSQLQACVLGSYLLKSSSDELSKAKGYWYNNTDILGTIPQVAKKLFI
jgi:hydroxyethylthiazole kinase-like uncharacterized protein yjeF